MGMKYCGNCGNPMKDDMRFCTKCGTMFGEGIQQSESGGNLEKLCGYNLVIDPKIMTWQHVHDLGTEGAVAFAGKHAALQKEVSDLVFEIMSDGETSALDKERVCSRVFDMAKRMLQNAISMMEDVEPIYEFRRQAVNQMISDLCSSGDAASVDEIRSMQVEADCGYRLIATLNGPYVADLIKSLQVNPASLSAENRSALIELSVQYNELWKSFMGRLSSYIGYGGEIDFAPTPGLASSFWDSYVLLTDALSSADIEMIDETSWIDCLEPIRRASEFRGEPVDEFINNAKSEIAKRIDLKKKREDSAYWADHPEKAEEKRDLDNKIAQLEKELEPLVGKLGEAESNRSKVLIDIDILKRKIKENEGSLVTCDLPLIFRKQRKQWKSEIDDCNAAISKLQSKAEELEGPIESAKKAADLKRQEIEAVKALIENLREK